MANPFNGSKTGKRGRRAGSDVARRRDDDFEPKHKDTASALIADQIGPFHECFAGETIADTLIPRKSLSFKQGLGVFTPTIEYEQIGVTKRLQTDKRTGEKVETTDPRYRIKWKSDTTLLRRGKPDNFGEGKRRDGSDKGTLFKRITSQSKRRVIEIEIKQGADTEIGINSPDVYNPIKEMDDEIAAQAPQPDALSSLDSLLNGDIDIDSLIDLS